MLHYVKLVISFLWTSRVAKIVRYLCTAMGCLNNLAALLVILYSVKTVSYHFVSLGFY